MLKFFLLLFSISFFTASAAQDSFVTSKVDHLNLRAGPRLDAKVQGHLMKGEKCLVLEKGDKEVLVSRNTGFWFHLQCENKRGWSFGPYLNIPKIVPYVREEVKPIEVKQVEASSAPEEVTSFGSSEPVNWKIFGLEAIYYYEEDGGGSYSPLISWQVNFFNLQQFSLYSKLGFSMLLSRRDERIALFHYDLLAKYRVTPELSLDIMAGAETWESKGTYANVAGSLNYHFKVPLWGKLDEAFIGFKKVFTISSYDTYAVFTGIKLSNF